ncbi:MAG: hypothetical protein Ct9H300mP27_12120 [Chloroflexota bacterium]|nr:MAG: hypothetical protein Ct9H300mP27_12120 [Chloroflexota bacterium]
MTIIGLVIIVALGWAYMIHIARGMDDNMSMAMPPKDGVELVRLVVNVFDVDRNDDRYDGPKRNSNNLIYAKVNHNRRQNSLNYVSTSVFLFGYLLAWTAFSMVATTEELVDPYTRLAHRYDGLQHK